MSKKRKQDWKAGDCFVIPLLDGGGLLGQVLAHEPRAMNSVSCALFDQRVGQSECPRPSMGRLFSILLVTRDSLDSGHWQVVATWPVEVPQEKFPFEHSRSKGFIGAKIYGSGVVREFANAFCGLCPWDDWAKPDYLDGLLVSPEVKPKSLLYKSSTP